MDIHGYTTYNLGGGGKDFIFFSPILGEMVQVDKHIFNWVVQPPTSDPTAEPCFKSLPSRELTCPPKTAF